MTHQELRDQFAMHAPAMPDDFERRGDKVERVIATNDGGYKVAIVTEWETDTVRLARWAYAYADAMLAARGVQ